MRILRFCVNASLRLGLWAMRSATTVDKERLATAFARSTLVRNKTVAQFAHEPWFIDTLLIYAKSVVETPYGQALEFSQPLIATISPNTACPFNCSDCFSSSGFSRKKPSAPMTNLTVERAMRSGAPTIMYGGGEPLYDPNLVSNLEKLTANGQWIYVATNGSIDRLMPHSKKFSTNVIFVLSLWESTKENDVRRGVGALDRLKKNINLASENGFRVNLNLVFATPNARLIDEAIGLIGATGVNCIYISRHIAVGRVATDDANYSLSDWRGLDCHFDKLRHYAKATIVSIPELRDQSRPDLRQTAEKLLGIPQDDRCSAGVRMIHFDEAGSALPCFAFDGQEFGVDASASPKETWRRVKETTREKFETTTCIGEQYARTRRQEGVREK